MITLAAAALCIAVVLPTRTTQTGFGTPKVLRFPGGADAAISLQFDDSMTTQLANALPMLNARKIRATFFVNTDSYQYKQHQHEWEVDVLKAGHELGNHTSHHSGAKTVEELWKEIGDCSDHLATVFGPKPRLVSFATPGGVPWNFGPEQLNPIYQKYHLVLAERRNFFEDPKTDPVTFVQHAIDTHSWSNVAMHGTGGEWLSTSLPTLTRLLDFLVAHRPSLWTAPEIEVYKYTQERDALTTPAMSPKGSNGFVIGLNCDTSKLAFTDLPVSALYDQPLTVEVAVPASWHTFKATQAGHTTNYAVQSTPAGPIARFDVLPNAGASLVVRT